MEKDYAVWTVELDILRLEFHRAGITNTASLDAADVCLARFIATQDSGMLLRLFGCLCFAAGRIGDCERLRRIMGLL